MADTDFPGDHSTVELSSSSRKSPAQRASELSSVINIQQVKQTLGTWQPTAQTGDVKRMKEQLELDFGDEESTKSGKEERRWRSE